MKNFKVKCVSVPNSEFLFTVGRVYEVENGILYNDIGFCVVENVNSVEEINMILVSQFELYEPILYNTMYIGSMDKIRLGERIGAIAFDKDGFSHRSLDIENVIFNPPATIVLWVDGTKTVVKRGKYDEFDPEKGLAMAICKKFLGNKGNYYNEFKKWLPDDQHVVHPYGGVKSDELVEAIRETDLYKNKEEENK